MRAGLVDAHVPRLAACLSDGHELVRRQVLALLAHLLQKVSPPTSVVLLAFHCCVAFQLLRCLVLLQKVSPPVLTMLLVRCRIALSGCSVVRFLLQKARPLALLLLHSSF